MAEVHSGTGTSAFWDVFLTGGCLVAHCSCGRIVFATRSDDYEAGELEKLRAHAQEKPDRFIEDAENDSVGITEIDGQEIAFGCKCNKAARYDNFLRAEAARIASFLRKVAEAERARADKVLTALENLS